MGTFVRWIRTLAVTLGAPGLFLVAFLDSSFLSLPEVADLLVIWMVTQHPGRLVWYVLGATLGSVAGCLILLLGRKGGEALIRKRFHAASVDRTLAAFRRHGIMAVLIRRSSRRPRRSRSSCSSPASPKSAPLASRRRSRLAAARGICRGSPRSVVRRAGAGVYPRARPRRVPRRRRPAGRGPRGVPAVESPRIAYHCAGGAGRSHRAPLEP